MRSFTFTGTATGREDFHDIEAKDGLELCQKLFPDLTQEQVIDQKRMWVKVFTNASEDEYWWFRIRPSSTNSKLFQTAMEMTGENTASHIVIRDAGEPSPNTTTPDTYMLQTQARTKKVKRWRKVAPAPGDRTGGIFRWAHQEAPTASPSSMATDVGVYKEPSHCEATLLKASFPNLTAIKKPRGFVPTMAVPTMAMSLPLPASMDMEEANCIESETMTVPTLAISLPLPASTDMEEETCCAKAGFSTNLFKEKDSRDIPRPTDVKTNTVATTHPLLEEDEQQVKINYRKKDHQRTDLPLRDQPQGKKIYALYGKWVNEAVIIARERKKNYYPEYVLVTVGTACLTSGNDGKHNNETVEMAPQRQIGPSIMEDVAAVANERLKRLYGQSENFVADSASARSSATKSNNMPFVRRGLTKFHSVRPTSNSAFEVSSSTIEANIKPNSEPSLKQRKETGSVLPPMKNLFMNELMTKLDGRGAKPASGGKFCQGIDEVPCDDSSSECSETDEVPEMIAPAAIGQSALKPKKMIVRTQSVADMRPSRPSRRPSFIGRFLKGSGKKTRVEI